MTDAGCSQAPPFDRHRIVVVDVVVGRSKGIQKIPLAPQLFSISRPRLGRKSFALGGAATRIVKKFWLKVWRNILAYAIDRLWTMCDMRVVRHHDAVQLSVDQDYYLCNTTLYKHIILIVVYTVTKRGMFFSLIWIWWRCLKVLNMWKHLRFVTMDYRINRRYGSKANRLCPICSSVPFMCDTTQTVPFSHFSIFWRRCIKENMFNCVCMRNFPTRHKLVRAERLSDHLMFDSINLTAPKGNLIHDLST